MKVAFDHLVHFVKGSPEEAVHRMNQLGLHAVIGGRHENWGTANALSYYDISYIEFLALEHPEVAEQARVYGLIDQLLEDLPRGEGLGTIALRTYDMEESIKHLRAQGVEVTGPFPGSRRRADGQVIRWKMLFIEKASIGCPYPFLIEWEQTDEERRKDLTLNKIIAPHSAGDIRLNYVAYAVSQLEETVKEWQQLFELEAFEPYVHEPWNAVCQLLALPGGNLLFCEPRGDGVVAEILRRTGERPFLVNLQGAKKASENQVMGSIYLLS